VLLRVAPGIRVSANASRHVREVGRTFLPAFVSRGVVQISAFIDTVIATFLPTGAVTGLANAQLIYVLPISVFGMSVAAAELPAMAGGGAEALRHRLDGGLRRIAFFVVPSAVAFVALGDVIAAALLQTGRFEASDADYVWGILAGSAVGLVAATLGRLYSSAYYALRDTATPLRYALIRVGCGTAMGYVAAMYGPGWFNLDMKWGAAGLTAASGVAAWIEMLLLRASLRARIGSTGLPASYLAAVWAIALAAAAAGLAVKVFLPFVGPLPAAAAVLGAYAAVFGIGTYVARIPEARALAARIRL
jgi:putative peptidoglycan lipid II flippase